MFYQPLEGGCILRIQEYFGFLQIPLYCIFYLFYHFERKKTNSLTLTQTPGRRRNFQQTDLSFYQSDLCTAIVRQMKSLDQQELSSQLQICQLIDSNTGLEDLLSSTHLSFFVWKRVKVDQNIPSRINCKQKNIENLVEHLSFLLL